MGLLGMSGKTFFGTPIRIMPPGLGASSYHLGTINVNGKIWNEFLNEGFDPWAGRHLMHEYGHYLQEKYPGKLNYYSQIVPAGLEAFQKDFAERD